MKYFGLIHSFALAVRADGTYAPFSADAWKYVGEMVLLGMGMIFCVLGLLWGVLALFKLAFVGKEKKPTEQKPQKVESPKTTMIEQPTAVSAPADDTQLIAVLTAAVAAYRDAEGEVGGFRVVSFKRSTGGRAWNAKK
jgi:sodium pump decarboxylase gamma subunit